MSRDDKSELGLANSLPQSGEQGSYVHSPPDSDTVNAIGPSEADAIPQSSATGDEGLPALAEFPQSTGEDLQDTELVPLDDELVLEPMSEEASQIEEASAALSDSDLSASPSSMEGLPPDTFSEVEDEVDAVVEEEKIQLVVFTLANECYGVDIGTVESVIKLQPITAVPQAPYFVEGLTNLRGTVLPVLDLRKRLGLPVFTPTKKSRIVVAKVGGIPAGLIVDSVDAVLRVSVGDIDPPSPINTATDSAYISGIAKLEDQLIILLDLKKVLPSV